MYRNKMATIRKFPLHFDSTGINGEQMEVGMWNLICRQIVNIPIY